MGAAPLVLLFAFAAVLCFVALALDWPRGLGFGLACLTTAVVLLPALTRVF